MITACEGQENQKPTASATYTVHIVPHTHWDREWYRPFQWFRGRLIGVVDTVMELLEDDDSRYAGFTLDGQAVLLEDYLELRPERRERIESLVGSGRLSVGPWYVLADEFLVSPESLIRNLMIGLGVSEALGRSLRVAYTPDSFGHISQLPLIVAGFGLDSIVFERGLGDEGEELGAEFMWRSADGESAVFTVHLVGTYSAAAAAGHADWEFRDAYSSRRAVEHVRAALYGAVPGELTHMPEFLRESLERIPGGLVAYANSSALLLLNGSDHLFPQKSVPQLVHDLNASFNDVRFLQSDLPGFIEDAKASAGRLNEYRGELRGSRYQHVLSGVLSSRIYLKQANNRCESRIERTSEPLAVLAWALGYGDYPKALFDAGWRMLLKNHPHDSICGCSIDSLHQQMMCRFSDVEDLLDYVDERSIGALSGSPRGIEHAAAGTTDYLVVFNPQPAWSKQVVHAELILPAGSGSTLALFDERQNQVPFSSHVETEAEPGKHSEFVDRVSVGFSTPLRPLGLTTLLIASSPSDAQRAGAQRISASGDHGSSGIVKREVPGGSAPSRARAPVKATQSEEGTLTLENGRITVTIAPEGELKIADLASGQTHRPQMYFEDVADAGDAYDFAPLAGDQSVIIGRAAAPPELVLDSSVEAVARLSYAAELPKRLSEDRSRRLGAVRARIRVDLTVAAESPSLGLRIWFDNQSCDHRLRLGIATGCFSDTVVAEGHFDSIERSLFPQVDSREWFQQPRASNHQRRFVVVEDGRGGNESAQRNGNRGIALINRGLPEYEACETDSDVHVIVTLIRSVGWLSRHDLSSRRESAGPCIPTPEAQCLGEHTFELALYPFSGRWYEIEVFAEADRLNAPAIVFNASGAAPQVSLLSLDDPLVLSSLKRAESRESIIVRVWNPTAESVSGRIELPFVPNAVFLARLDESRQATLENTGRTIALTFAPRAVRTVEIALPLEMWPEGTHEQEV